jgi:hypothetical protein
MSFGKHIFRHRDELLGSWALALSAYMVFRGIPARPVHGYSPRFAVLTPGNKYNRG